MNRIEPLFVCNNNNRIVNSNKNFQNGGACSVATKPVSAKLSADNLKAYYCTKPSFGHLASFHMQNGGAYVEKATKKVFFNLFTYKDVKEVFVVVKNASSGKNSFHKMAKDEKNIYRTVLSPNQAKDGDKYAFKILKENGESFLAPDPRAQRKVDFKSPFSEIYDQNKYRWTDKDWMDGKISAKISRLADKGLTQFNQKKTLEINIPTFSKQGNFAGAIKEIDKLAKKGLFKADGTGVYNAIEIMPLESSFASGWSYDGIYKGAVLEELGGPDGLKALINHMHSKNINAVIDAVPNHFGCDGNPFGKIGPYFNQTNKDKPFGERFNLENDVQNNSQVRDFLTDICGLNWLRDYHFDGIRFDLTHAMDSDNALREMVEEMNYHYPNAFVILEDNRRYMNDRLTRQIPAQKTDAEHVNSIKIYEDNKNSLNQIGANARWSYEVEHCMNRAVKGHASVSELYKSLKEASENGEILYGIRQSHDEIGNENAVKAVSDIVSNSLGMFAKNRVEGINDKEKGIRAAQATQALLTKFVSGKYTKANIDEIAKTYHIVNMPTIEELGNALLNAISKNKVSESIISSIPKTPKMTFMGGLADITPFRFFRTFSENAEADYKMLEAEKGYRAGKEALEESKLSSIKYVPSYKKIMNQTDQYQIDLNKVIQSNSALKTGYIAGGVTHDGSKVMGMHLKNGSDEAYTVSNLSDFSYNGNYNIWFPQGKWKVSICSEAEKYAGNGKNLQANEVISDGRNQVAISIPANSFTVFQKIS